MKILIKYARKYIYRDRNRAAGFFWKNRIAFGLTVFFILLLLPAFRPQLPSDITIVHQQPSFYGELIIFDFKKSIRCLLIDGTLQSCWNNRVQGAASVATQYLRASLLARPDAKRILILGMGAETITREWEKRFGLNLPFTVDIVDIDPVVPELNRRFFNYQDTEQKNIIIQDARYFLTRTAEKYDIVIVDIGLGYPTVPHLTTIEMFQLVKERLNPEGIITLHWTSDIKHPDSFLKVLVKTLSRVFSNVKLTAQFPSSAKLGGLGPVIIYASDGPIERRFFRDQIKELEDLSYDDSTIVFTDDFMPIDTLVGEAIIEEHKSLIKNFGESLFLQQL